MHFTLCVKNLPSVFHPRSNARRDGAMLRTHWQQLCAQHAAVRPATQRISAAQLMRSRPSAAATGCCRRRTLPAAWRAGWLHLDGLNGPNGLNSLSRSADFSLHVIRKWYLWSISTPPLLRTLAKSRELRRVKPHSD